jgi:predicted DNA-binding transcriptional regulator AlpA
MINLPENTNDLISIDEVAKLFGVKRLAMRQTIKRENWPAPMRLKRKDCWLVGTLKKFFEDKQEEAINNQKHVKFVKVVK